LPRTLRANDVFINCPFDEAYRPIFHAIVFTVYNLGFVARCSLEEDDASDFRLGKIERLVEECTFGINDLSAVQLDAATRLPRFNMPLELGLFLGCKRFGGRSQRNKKCLILENQQYRYQAFISDIAGQDIKSHDGSPETAMRCVRDWLSNASGRSPLPGGAEVIKRFKQFQSTLPDICARLKLEPDKLTFLDLSNTISDWLQTG